MSPLNRYAETINPVQEAKFDSKSHIPPKVMELKIILMTSLKKNNQKTSHRQWSTTIVIFFLLSQGAQCHPLLLTDLHNIANTQSIQPSLLTSTQVSHSFFEQSADICHEWQVALLVKLTNYHLSLSRKHQVLCRVCFRN